MTDWASAFEDKVVEDDKGYDANLERQRLFLAERDQSLRNLEERINKRIGKRSALPPLTGATMPLTSPDVMEPPLTDHMTGAETLALLSDQRPDGPEEAALDAVQAGINAILADPVMSIEAKLDAVERKQKQDELVDMLATVCYGVDRQFCIAMGDYSRLPWHMVKDDVHEMFRRAVRHICANNDATPGDLHSLWVEAKASEGWTYGKFLDWEKREHPCMVAFLELPLMLRAKSFIFLAIVRELAGMALADVAEGE